MAKKVPCLQYFGKHPERPDEYRGDDVMDPPKSYSDDYQWLRDDNRKNEEVSSFFALCIQSAFPFFFALYITLFPFTVFNKLKVLTHIEAENAYCESEMSDLAPLTETLYAEMLQYLKESDEEVPYRDGEFEYFSKTVKGLAYTIHCRRAVGTTSRKIT